MTGSDFLRVFQLRSPQLMWFLGAGASAAARVPTAGHLILDFKRTLYCTENRVSVRAYPNAADPAFVARLRAYFTPQRGFPAENSEDEYAFFFEHTYPSEQDRRRYLHDLTAGAVPSYGHMALAALSKLDLVRVLWTTNFDRAPEDALAKVFGTTSRIAVATLDHPELADQALTEGRYPLIGKLHGDFQSRRLKNTGNELQTQNAAMRRAFVGACRTRGLAVVGYSGRDASVLEAMEEAVDSGQGFPSGLFWFHRPGSPPYPRAVRLIDQASAAGVDAHLVEVDNFDELMGDIFLLVKDVPAELSEFVDRAPRRLIYANVPGPGPSGATPVIRLNALPVTAFPTTCRRLVCNVGGAKETFEAANSVGADIIVGRRQVGILAFGSDEQVRKAFERYGITEFDLHRIEPHRLNYDDSVELGMLNDAIAKAIMRERPVKGVPGRRGWKIYVDDQRLSDPALSTLKAAVGTVGGTVPGTGLKWADAVRVKLERRLDRMWLLFEPAVWFADTNEEGVVAVAKEFVRERLASRYNAAVNKVFDGWSSLIAGGSPEAELRTYGVGAGVDAVFRVSRTTAFSRRWGIR